MSGASYMIFQYVFSADEYGFLNSNLLSLNIIVEAIPWLKNENRPVLRYSGVAVDGA